MCLATRPRTQGRSWAATELRDASLEVYGRLLELMSADGSKKLRAHVELARKQAKTIHVINATEPAAPSPAMQSAIDGGFSIVPAWCAPLSNCHGWVEAGPESGAGSGFSVEAHFDLNQKKWVFQLLSVTHAYKWGHRGIMNPGWRINLPDGNPPVFPLATGMNLQQSKQEAKGDLDPTGLILEGPRRRTYWVESITVAHEMAHRDHFYNQFWRPAMSEFETDVVEATLVTFDCEDIETMTSQSVLNAYQQTWAQIALNRHLEAYDSWMGTAFPEIHAHSISNPMYLPIWGAIQP